jgi:hypothetical protein
MSKPQALSAVTSATAESKDNMTEFRVEVHGLGSDERVTLCGSDAALGAWNPDKAVTLTRDAACSLPFSASCGMWRCQVRIRVYPRVSAFIVAWNASNIIANASLELR